MKFRPCIDIHNGKVKQIVGGSLRDAGDTAQENFVSEMTAADYARLYRARGLTGGHVILLNGAQSPYYEETKRQALSALAAWPGGLQVGGGVTPENAGKYLQAGASHVIVTSYVFREGRIDRERLARMRGAVGKEHLVLDVSCKWKDGQYFVVTDRWQKLTDACVTEGLLDWLAEYCDEFLVHGVDVEGSGKGPAKELVRLLGNWAARASAGADDEKTKMALESAAARETERKTGRDVSACANRITYAGGIGTYEDIALLRSLGQGRLDYTVGSALDLFGGSLSFERLCSSKGQKVD